MVRVHSLASKSLLLLCAALVLPSCEKSGGSGRPAAAPRSGQPSAQEGARQPEEEKADDQGSGDEQLVPPPEDGYAPVD